MTTRNLSWAQKMAKYGGSLIIVVSCTIGKPIETKF